MTLDQIRDLLRLFNESGVGELEVEGDRVRIRKNLVGGDTDFDFRATRVAREPEGASASAAGYPAQTEPDAQKAPVKKEPPEAEDDPNVEVVKSPIVGTFYSSPSPGSPTFVKAGDTIKVGQILCIIESMKLMNEIESEVSGVVIKELVANSQPVEYGQGLYLVRKQ